MKKILAVCFVLVFALAIIVSFASPPVMAQEKERIAPSCTLSALNSSFTATTQIVAAPTTSTGNAFINGVSTPITSAQKVQLCSVRLIVQQTTGAADFGLVTGTGTNCATGQANFTPQWVGTASVIDKYEAYFSSDGPLIAPAGKALCVKLSATPTKAQALFTYGLRN